MKRDRNKDHVHWQRGSHWLSRSSPQCLLGGFFFFKNRSVSDLHYGSASISSHSHHCAERQLSHSNTPSVRIIISGRQESNVGATSREVFFSPLLLMTASRRLLGGSPAHFRANSSLQAAIRKVALEGHVSSGWAEWGQKNSSGVNR